MKNIIKTLFLLAVMASVASAYTVSYEGTTGNGYFTINGAVTNAASGFCQVAWVSTNETQACQGIIVNGNLIRSYSPWSVTVSMPTTLSPYLQPVPPQPYVIRDGVMAITVPTQTSGWVSVTFAAPNQVNFVNDGKSCLFPALVNCVTVKAVDGDIEVNTTTNGVKTVTTLGQEAVIPVAPAVLGEGESIVINTQISKLYIRGTGKANIVGVSK